MNGREDAALPYSIIPISAEVKRKVENYHLPNITVITIVTYTKSRR